MRRSVRIIVIALLAGLVLALAVGCGASRQALGPERPRVELVLPPVEAAELRLRKEAAGPPPQLPPYAVTDESAGRWLTLFELNFGLSEAAGVPPAAPESPGAPADTR